MKKYIEPRINVFNVRMESLLTGASKGEIIKDPTTQTYQSILDFYNDGDGTDATGKEDFGW